MVLTPATLFFFTVTPTGSSLQLVYGERENLGLIYKCFCVIHRHLSKVDSCGTTAPFWDILKDSGEGKTSQRAELQAMQPAIHSSWEEKWPDVWLDTNLRSVANDWAEWSGTWTWLETGDKEVWGRSMWIDLSECSVSASAEEKFNNQVDRVIYSVDTRQLLSPATPVITWRAHEQSGHGGRDGAYVWAQQHGLLLTKPTWLWQPLSAQSASSDTNTGPLMWHHSPGWSAAIWWQDDCIGLFPSWKGNVCVCVFFFLLE